ncbi:MAG: sulfatase-like hydrolase/transferase [Blastocatellia bacterium]|nr:sulfatase-like hydrolase/transferase [Blastocatellia bacterium]
MSRTRRILSLLLVGLLLVSTRATRAGGEQAPAPKLNLISIVTDDQAAWSIGAYGNRESRTPNMDRLAREGVRFTNAFVTTPVCSPSRAGFMTGLYGTQVGITDYLTPEEGVAGRGLPVAVTTWPQALQRNGWRTGLFGKWHLGTQPQFDPRKRGFDAFFGAPEGSFAPMNPTLVVDGAPKALQGPASDLVMDEAIRFIEGNRARPFAALIHFREPHTPYGPMPEEDAALFRNLDPTVPQRKGLDVAQIKQWHREYYAAVHAVDRNIGKLLAKLDEWGIAKNTIVLFQSDHGYNIGHHGIHTKGNGIWVAGGVSGPKRPNMWDTSLRIPVLLRWPGVVAPGSELNETVTQLDMFASILGMLGVEMPAGVKQNGEDFSPLLRGRKRPWRDAIFGQYDLYHLGLAHMRMIRTPEWKLVRHHHADGLDELYDLKNDPDENRNLYADPARRATRDQLQQRLTAWMQSIGDPLSSGRRPGR